MDVGINIFVPGLSLQRDERLADRKKHQASRKKGRKEVRTYEAWGGIWRLISHQLGILAGGIIAALRAISCQSKIIILTRQLICPSFNALLTLKPYFWQP